MLPLGAARPRKVDAARLSAHAPRSARRGRRAAGSARISTFASGGRWSRCRRCASAWRRCRGSSTGAAQRRRRAAARRRSSRPRSGRPGRATCASCCTRRARPRVAPPTAPAGRGGAPRRRRRPRARRCSRRALKPSDPLDVARIREALEREQGNVSRAARQLGMHRTQLRRWIARHGGSPTTKQRHLGCDPSRDPASGAAVPAHIPKRMLRRLLAPSLSPACLSTHATLFRLVIVRELDVRPHVAQQVHQSGFECHDWLGSSGYTLGKRPRPRDRETCTDVSRRRDCATRRHARARSAERCRDQDRGRCSVAGPPESI